MDQRLRSNLTPRRGELTRTVVRILNAADLTAVPLLTLDKSDLAPPTSVRLPPDLHARLKQAAVERKVTMYTLVNSAMRAYYESEI